MRYSTTIGKREFLIEILDDRRLVLDGKTYEVDFASIGGQQVFSLLLDGISYETFVYPADKGWQVVFRGQSYAALVEEEMEKQLRIALGSHVSETAEYHLKAPMPGMVVAVQVVDGQTIHKGEVLVVLESMKMQNELKAPRDGVITRLRIKAGDGIEQHQIMLTLV